MSVNTLPLRVMNGRLPFGFSYLMASDWCSPFSSSKSMFSWPMPDCRRNAFKAREAADCCDQYRLKGQSSARSPIFVSFDSSLLLKL